MKSKILVLLCLVLSAVMLFASCEEKPGTTHTHTFSGAWTSNETHHWKAATCEHGGQKSEYAGHTDADENGLCDVCEYEVGHTHTLDEEWQSDETHHWKNATCTHTDFKGELSLHADANTDGACDTCSGHVHVMNVFGFCAGCDVMLNEIEENVLGSVVYATAGRKKFITGGTISFSSIGRYYTGESDSRSENVLFTLGTNGVYFERSEINSEGKTETVKQWVKALPNGDAEGIDVVTVDGVVVNAYPGSYSLEDLGGYYYQVGIAEGFGAEKILIALYEASQGMGNADADTSNDKNIVKNLIVNHDPDNKSYSFSYELLALHVTNSGQGDGEASSVYNVQYYVVDASFTYDDNYALTSLSFNIDRYTNDAGGEEEVDFEYDPATDEVVWLSTKTADTYTVVTSQTTGTKTEIAMNDGSAFIPTDFDIYTDKEFTNKAENIEFTLGTNTELFVSVIPADSFMSFIINDITVRVTDKNGKVVSGIASIGLDRNNDGNYFIGITANIAGEFVLTVNYKDTVKTVNITIPGVELGGENTFEVVSEDNNNIYFNYIYEFKATKNGTYTFYLPYGVGVVEVTELDYDGFPVVTDENVIFDYQTSTNDPDPREGTFSFTKTLRAGQTYKLGFKFRTKNVTYTIGYDEP